MSFNLNLQRRCRRTERMAEDAYDAFSATLEPFSLEKCYPPTPREVEPGEWNDEYIILPHQEALHKGVSPSGHKADFILYSSGVGAGKTLNMCAEMYRQLRTLPGIKIVVVTAYDYYFDEFILPIWYQVLPEKSRHILYHNRKSRTQILTNRSSIRFKAYDDPDKIKGWDCHRLWVEEGSELGNGNNDKAMAIWNALHMRRRSTRPGYPLRTYVTQNPKGHNYLWRIFIRNQPDAPQPLGDVGRKVLTGVDKNGKDTYYKEWEKVGPSNVYYTIACKSSTNKFLPEGYVETMLGQMAESPGLRERMVEGEFNPINSLVYDEPVYSERTHLIDYQAFLSYWDITEMPSWWRVVVGIDVGGTRSPWAIEYYIQTEDGHWVCFDEIYKIGLMWDEVADMIEEKSSRFSNVNYWIDPISSALRQGPTFQDIKTEFEYRGIRAQAPKGYNKMGGIARVQNFLNRDRHTPCPYMEDVMNESNDGSIVWEIGHSQLYYLTNVPGKHSLSNPTGHSCPGNIAEKQLYRWDQAKQSHSSSNEMGGPPVMSTKLVDRDDHAQTAEMFWALGINPISRQKTVTKAEPIRDNYPVMYGLHRKRRRV